MGIHQPAEPAERARHYNGFFIFLLVSTLYGVARLLSPFAGALLASLACVATFYPVCNLLERHLPRSSPSFRAFLADTIVFTLFIVPVVLLTWAVIEESSSLGPVMRRWSLALDQWRQGHGDSLPPMRFLRALMDRTVGMRQAQFQEHLAGWVGAVLSHISGLGAEIAGHIIDFVFDLLLVLFALFFLFRDGKKLLEYFDDLIPLAQNTKEKLLKRIYDTIVGVSRGWFLTSLIQGVIAMVGYFIVGTEGAVLLGALTAVSGLVPGIGTAIIWVPTGIFYLATGAYLKGIFVLLWGALVVTLTVDVIVRPYLMGKKAKLPFVLLFFALLGGLEMWGLKGVIIGPVLMSLVPPLLETYRYHYLDKPDRKPTS